MTLNLNEDLTLIEHRLVSYFIFNLVLENRVFGLNFALNLIEIGQINGVHLFTPHGLHI